MAEQTVGSFSAALIPGVYALLGFAEKSKKQIVPVPEPVPIQTK